MCMQIQTVDGPLFYAASVPGIQYGTEAELIRFLDRKHCVHMKKAFQRVAEQISDAALQKYRAEWEKVMDEIWEFYDRNNLH